MLLSSTLSEVVTTLRLLPPSATRVILTRTEEQMMELKNMLVETVGVEGNSLRTKQEYIFTVEQFKGLEADCVILWRFFAGDTKFWSEIASTDSTAKPAVRLSLYDVLTECNRLYVALTRPHRYLAIFDEEGDPAPWHLPAYHAVELKRKDAEWLRTVQQSASSPEEHARFARLLEDSHLLSQAAVAYDNAGDTASATRCRGLLAEMEERWGDAGREWYELRNWGRAQRCFELAGDFVGKVCCAAEQMEEAGDWRSAASVWHGAKKIRREARAWEEANEWETAYACWKRITDEDHLPAFELRYVSHSLALLDEALLHTITAVSTRLP